MSVNFMMFSIIPIFALLYVKHFNARYTTYTTTDIQSFVWIKLPFHFSLELMKVER